MEESEGREEKEHSTIYVHSTHLSSDVCYFVQHRQGRNDFEQQQQSTYQGDGDPTPHFANFAIPLLRKIEALCLQHEKRSNVRNWTTSLERV